MYNIYEVLYIIERKSYLTILVVCTRLSSAHTPTRKLVGVWALNKLVHTNRYCDLYNTNVDSCHLIG